MTKGNDYIDVREVSAGNSSVLNKFVIPQYEIVEYFSEVQSKDQIIEGFLRFGGHCFANLAVFSVFSRAIQFLKGRGDNIKRPSYLGTFNIDKNTIIRRAVVNKFPYRGPIPIGVDEKSAFGKFFNRFAEEVFLYPGSIRGGETDVLFYAEGFEDNRESSLATFEYVAEKTILAFQLLWVQKQLTTI